MCDGILLHQFNDCYGFGNNMFSIRAPKSCHHIVRKCVLIRWFLYAAVVVKNPFVENLFLCFLHIFKELVLRMMLCLIWKLD